MSSDLVEHETTCESKPPVPVKRRIKKESNSINEENGNEGDAEIDDVDDEDLNEEDDCGGNVE